VVYTPGLYAAEEGVIFRLGVLERYTMVAEKNRL